MCPLTLAPTAQLIHSDFWLLRSSRPAELNPGFRLRSTLGYHLTPRWGSRTKRLPAASQMPNLQRQLEVTHKGAGRSRQARRVLSFQRGNFR